MSKALNIAGQRFGRLTALNAVERTHHTFWSCRCDCGGLTLVALGHLRSGHTKSCGCLRNVDKIKHGCTCGRKPTRKYLMWCHAKRRAKAKGQVFTITPSDIHIPKRCPLLGTILRFGHKVMSAASPTIDRLKGQKGYTPENIWVISARANAIKSDATLKELKRLYTRLEKEIKRRRACRK